MKEEKQGKWSTITRDTSGKLVANNVDAHIMDSLIREQLLNIRKSRHLTQKQLSEMSGLSESCISNIENVGGTSSPTLRSLVRYATALDIDIYIDFHSDDDKDLHNEAHLDK